MLELIDVNKSYSAQPEDVQVLSGINLRVEPAQTISIGRIGTYTQQPHRLYFSASLFVAPVYRTGKCAAADAGDA